MAAMHASGGERKLLAHAAPLAGLRPHTSGAVAAGYDAFADYSTKFWTASLEPYLSAFARTGLPHSTLRWSWHGAAYTSVLVSLPGCSMVTLEFMSGKQANERFC